MNKTEFKEGDKGWFWEPYGLEYLYCEIAEIDDNRYICQDVLGHKYPVNKDKFFKTKKKLKNIMKIKDLKKGDIVYWIFDNGTLYFLHCLTCNLIDKDSFQYEIVFTIDDYKGTPTCYQNGNENYINDTHYTIFLNKEDAIEELNYIKNSCEYSINEINKRG